MEKIVETKQCKNCQMLFDITDEDLEFYDKVSPIFNDKKYHIPAPQMCPDCRQQRRLHRQNMSKLYKRNCDATGKPIISNFSPDKPFKIYDQNFRWSHQWDFKTYGRNVDLQRSFLEQLKELSVYVPMPNMFTEFLNDVNSTYTNFAGYNKNCYLIFHADMNEDCLYATGLKKSKRCIDGLNVFTCELAYQCVDCEDCYNIRFCQDCENCANSRFLKSCIGCKNCFGSINLQNAEYCIFNKQYTKEEYTKFINDFDAGKTEAIQVNRDKFMEIQKKAIYKSVVGHQNQDCSGDHLFKCRDVTKSRDIKESRDMKFCERIYNGPNNDCYDVDQFGMRIERVYNASVIGNESQSVVSCALSYTLHNVYYSVYSFNSQNCFGCIGARQAEYCILNKQYTKEEYEILVPQIIERMQIDGERGEFFPLTMSLFGYNETIAQEYFPLTKDDALKAGFPWSDYEPLFPKVERILTVNEIPRNIDEASDTILQQAIECEVSKKPFRITKAELDFYRTQSLPLPTKHPDIRHAERMALRNPKKLRDRKCKKCGIDIKTSYAPERSEIVYCEECYNKEIYG